jgi:hypothetical protein
MALPASSRSWVCEREAIRTLWPWLTRDERLILPDLGSGLKAEEIAVKHGMNHQQVTKLRQAIMALARELGVC